MNSFKINCAGIPGTNASVEAERTNEKTMLNPIIVPYHILYHMSDDVIRIYLEDLSMCCELNGIPKEVVDGIINVATIVCRRIDDGTPYE